MRKKFKSDEIQLGLKLLKQMDINEQVQKKMVQLERDSDHCSSDVANQSVKLEKEINALNVMKVIDNADYMSFSDQIENTTDKFRRHCKCFNTQIGDETFP